MRRATIWVLALVFASCAVDSGADGSPADTAAPSSVVPTPASTTPVLTPSTTTTTAPLPEFDLSAPSVWFGPNFGSVDFPNLFSQPRRWRTARRQVDVVKFYANSVSGFPFDIGGDNVLSTFVDVGAFENLLDWNIAIAVEAGAIKFFECSPDPWAEYTNAGIANIEANGGRVSFVAMDEPLIGGQILENDLTCGFSMAETAEVVADYVDQVRSANPEVQIGDIEAYPHYSAPELEEWILALEETGYTPAFFHLDVDIERAQVEGQDVVADLRRLEDFTADRDIPFGVILTANWTFTDTDERYYESTMRWTEIVRTALEQPTHVILQSWWGPAPSGLHEVPVNLPENDPDVYSHTRLILEVLKFLEHQ